MEWRRIADLNVDNLRTFRRLRQLRTALRRAGRTQPALSSPMLRRSPTQDFFRRPERMVTGRRATALSTNETCCLAFHAIRLAKLRFAAIAQGHPRLRASSFP